HLTKASSRVLINTSPEPFSNWAASLAEDTLAAGMVWLAFTHPLLLMAVLVLLVMLTIWLLPKLWRGVRRAITAARQVLGFSG
ncbi:MAG: protein of unknown function (DUF4126)/Short C-terminal domain, partial [Betaproteobacteria bacterium]|nr:protein of unknown function (DUF4126)/Short C-terminal domain [Betaproteobacteria bacterium]